MLKTETLQLLFELIIERLLTESGELAGLSIKIEVDCEYMLDSRSIFSKWFILNQHFMNDILCIFSDMLLIFFAQFIRIDWFAVFYYNFGR